MDRNRREAKFILATTRIVTRVWRRLLGGHRQRHFQNLPIATKLANYGVSIMTTSMRSAGIRKALNGGMRLGNSATLHIMSTRSMLIATGRTARSGSGRSHSVNANYMRRIPVRFLMALAVEDLAYFSVLPDKSCRFRRSMQHFSSRLTYQAFQKFQCFSGIRCPLGTWRIPRTTPYIRHGDEKALAAALPENLKLIPQK